VFAVHPLQMEAVAWISGMNNLLAALFSLGCIAAYMRAAQAERRRFWVWYGVAVIAFIAALFSKPTAIVTPLVILAIEALVLRRPWRRMAWSAGPFFLLAIPFAIVARAVQPASGTFAPPLLQRLSVAGDAIGFYFCKLVWPMPLLIDYGRNPAVVLTSGSLAFSLAAGLAITIAVTAWRWRLHGVTGGLAVFVAGMLLVLGLVPFDFQDFSTVADRYVYLSMLGVSIASACVVAHLSTHKLSRFVTVAMLLVIVFWSVLSIRQSGLWTDNENLARHTLAHNPTSLAAHMVLGYTAEHRGDRATAEQIYRDGLATFPNDGGLNRDLANLIFRDRPAEAIPYFQTAFLHTRFDPRLVNNLGSALLNTGHVPEAIDAFRLVLQKYPNHLNANINLGHAYLMQGKLNDAEPPLRRALEIDPTSASAARWMNVLRNAKSRAPIN